MDVSACEVLDFILVLLSFNNSYNRKFLQNNLYIFFVQLKALVKNRAHPEGSIAEGYRTEECMTFCSRFLQGTTRFTRPFRNPEPVKKIKEMYLFQTAGTSIGKTIRVTEFDSQLLVQAHRYILRHCDELDALRE